MSEGDNLNFLKTQTYVLKVNTHCEGCKHKVKKLLQKIDGVYTISIDSEQEKVTVTGTVDPAALIKKLSKAGKHSELLLAPKGGGNNKDDNFLQEQLQKLQLETGKSRQKESGIHQKDQQLPQQMKGSQDLKLPQLKDFKLPPPKKEQKNVKFDVPIDPTDDLDDDEGSEFDDDAYDSEDYDDDDEDDDLDSIVDFEDDPKQSNLTPMKDPKKGSGGNDKKGDGEKDKKANGGKNLDDNAKHSNCEKNSAKNLDNAKNSNGGKKTGGGGGGGGGQPMNLNPKMVMSQGGNQEMDMERMKAPMGHAMSMPPGYYQGGGMAGPDTMSAPTNPYLHQQQQQQQYMAAMQQRMMMMNGGPQITYGQPMGYGAPAYGEPAYAHYFSDENANSCSIM